MNRVVAIAFSAFLGLGIVPGAQAAIITADPDSFAAGTDISTAFAGLTLSVVGSGLGSSGTSIFAVNPAIQGVEPFTASTGSLSFGTDSGSFPHLFRETGFATMRVDFALATNFVSLDYISDDSADTGLLQIFDASDVLLGSYTTASLAANAFETMSFTSGSANIAYILAGGLDSASSGGLDNLKYEGVAATGVPEPATVGLFAVGIAAVSALRRRRKSSRHGA